MGEPMTFSSSPYTVAPPGENGSLVSSPSPPAGPRLPKRLVWLDLPQEEYPGFKVRVWVNAPQRLFAQLSDAEDQDGIKHVLSQLIVEHNDWQDFDGRPLPAAAESAFWDEIPNELAGAIIAMLVNEVGKLATSLVPQRRGR